MSSSPSGERIRARRATPPPVIFAGPPALEFTGETAGHTRRRAAPGLAALAAGATMLAAASPALAMSATQAAQAPLLSQGSRGPAVTQLQRSLHIARTGRFTAGTRHAVMHFQAVHQLQVDGIVGPQTRDALFGIKPTSIATSTTAVDAGDYTIPSSIVECESGGDYSAVNASSGAGGAYQILPSTWAAYGGQGLPEDASPAEQNAIAAKIYAADGPSAWSC
jgi:peptidoglycan hydrolase-like protein with peptidoglycan-binding domain